MNPVSAYNTTVSEAPRKPLRVILSKGGFVLIFSFYLCGRPTSFYSVTFSDVDLPVLVADIKKTEANEAVKTLGILGNDLLMDAGGISLDYKTGCMEVPH